MLYTKYTMAEIGIHTNHIHIVQNGEFSDKSQKYNQL